MPFTSTARDIAVTVRSDGKLTQVLDASGNPTYDNTETHAVFGRHAAIKGAWWLDEQGTYGSSIFEIKNLKRSTPSDIQTKSIACVQPLVTVGRISNFKAVATISGPGQARLDLSWSTPTVPNVSIRYAITR